MSNRAKVLDRAQAWLDLCLFGVISRPLQASTPMSAVPPKADISRAGRHVRFVLPA